MITLPFKLEAARLTSRVDAVYLTELDGSVIDQLRDAVLEAITTDLQLTIGGVTMHAAAWFDPDHWSSDWQAVNEDAYAIIANAVTVKS